MTTKEDSILTRQIGTAGANISFGERELEVIPLEESSNLDGEVNDMMGEITSSGTDKDGSTYATSVKVANTVKALYLPLDAHRPYPSLIRRGEKVLLFRLGDTDKYYWTEMGLDDTTRRKDIYTILIPNSPTEGENSKTYKTAYYIEANTVDKHITIQTNKNDGEEFAYGIQINSGGSTVTIMDDDGQWFQLDSKAKKISMQNSMGSKLGIEKRKGFIEALESIDCKTKDYNVTCTNYNVKTVNYNMTASAGCNMNSQGAYAVKSSTFTHNSINVGDSHAHKNVKSGSDTSGGPV